MNTKSNTADDGHIDIEPIAHIRTAFPTKFGIPRQSGLVPELEGEVVFEPKYRDPDALRGIETFSHLWLIWGFSENEPENEREGFRALVRPPRLGGNEKRGVFATRSPFRPNNLGLSVVELVGVEKTKGKGSVLKVRGADLMDGTPIYDVKPYLAYADAVDDAQGGFAEDPDAGMLTVVMDDAIRETLGQRADELAHVLARDPRPAYHDDPNRAYCLEYGGWDVRFEVAGDTLTVTGIDERLA